MSQPVSVLSRDQSGLMSEAGPQSYTGRPAMNVWVTRGTAGR
jgi:hypothetical protein